MNSYIQKKVSGGFYYVDCLNEEGRFPKFAKISGVNVTPYLTTSRISQFQLKLCGICSRLGYLTKILFILLSIRIIMHFTSESCFKAMLPEGLCAWRVDLIAGKTG